MPYTAEEREQAYRRIYGKSVDAVTQEAANRIDAAFGDEFMAIASLLSDTQEKMYRCFSHNEETGQFWNETLEEIRTDLNMAKKMLFDTQYGFKTVDPEAQE